MKTLSRHTCLAFMAVLLGACAAGPQLNWVNTKMVSHTEKAPSNLASVVVYRSSQEGFLNTVNVYIGSEYLASLSSGSYSQATLCPGRQVFYANVTGTDSSYYGKHNNGYSLELAAGSSNYIKVVNQNGQPSLQAVPAEQARNEMAGMPKQSHTLPRIKQNQTCLNAG